MKMNRAGVAGKTKPIKAKLPTPKVVEQEAEFGLPCNPHE